MGSWASVVVASEKDPQRRALLRTMLRCVTEWDLIAKNDRILVALSGGKDSYTLFDLLWTCQQRSPLPFEIVGVHLDQAQPGYEGERFYRWLDALGAPYEILREDTYSVVKDKTRPGQAYCVICSRLRRGILYDAAERLGCNKLALGHHRDDGLQTLLLNLFYAGKLQAMPAGYTTDDGRFEVIRPLMDTAETDIAAHAAHAGYPILPCNLCGNQEGLKREQMKALLSELEENHPDLRQVMHHAVKNIRPTHLLDAEVRTAWKDRAEEPGSKTVRLPPPGRHKPAIVKRGGLPIVGQSA